MARKVGFRSLQARLTFVILLGVLASALAISVFSLTSLYQETLNQRKKLGKARYRRGHFSNYFSLRRR
jgi:hypothetical protein